MEFNTVSHFMFNYKQMVLDEVSLEGLEGIGFEQLCKHIQHRTSSIVTDKMRQRFWSFVVNSQSISLYKVQTPTEPYEIVDRFEIVHEETGNILEPDYFLDGSYEYSPVENLTDYGSCRNYTTRALIPKCQIQTLSFEEANAEYGDSLVLVASIEDRWQALAPHMPISYLTTMTPIQYCILELVGKGRRNGQMTVGNTNLLKIVREPKLLFYNKKYLQDLDFIRVQSVTHFSQNKWSKGLLVRLKRFYTPNVVPKSGQLNNLVNYLLTKPDYSEKTENILKMGIINAPKMKKLQKTVNMFRFEDRYEATNLPKKGKPGTVKKKYISLMVQSEESSQSEEESQEPLKCQYKVGINLMRQAYECIKQSGLKGLTQVDLSQMLGIEFYTSRGICRVFKKNGIIREFLEDKGKQRLARYIVQNATCEMDDKFESEKKKFMEYLKHSKKEADLKRPIDDSKDSDDEVPHKKIKTNDEDNSNEGNQEFDSEDVVSRVTEVEQIIDEQKFRKSFIKGGSSLTLRQLRFANGVLKVVWDRTIVTGFVHLSNLVAAEIGEPPMDTKAIKNFIQKLAIDGQIKVLKMKWPNYENQYSFLICVPHIKNTDRIIKDKYKEICIKALTKKTRSYVQDMKFKERPISQLAFPRYFRFQTLHEFIFEYTYVNKIENKFKNLPDGFTSLVDIIPELTVKFALGFINNINEVNEYHIPDETLDLKLKEAPPDLYKILAQSNSFKNSLRETLKNLAALALIQIIKSNEKTDNCYGFYITSFTFYVNRHAKIIDTTGVWPRENANTGTLTKTFYLETMEDVKNYWKTVKSVSTSTSVNLSSQERRKTKLSPPLRFAEEAALCDKGECIGDGCGPCGFHSIFFMEIGRYWQTYHTKNKVFQTLVKRAPKTKKVVKKPKLKVKPKTRKHNIQSSALPKVTPLSKGRRSFGPEPKIKWIPIEDKIITICKAALSVTTPIHQPGFFTIRNGVAKDMIELIGTKKGINFFASSIHKRSNTLESDADMNLLKERIMCLLRSNKNLIAKYEYTLKHTRILNEGKVAAFNIIWVIIQLLKIKESNDLSCIAANLEELHKKFTVAVKMPTNRLTSLYKTINDPLLSTMKECVVMSLIMANEPEYNKTMAKKVYKIFQSYPDKVLRTAIEQLRKCNAISARDKLTNNLLAKLNVRDMVKVWYKTSHIYKKKFGCKLNSEFVDDLSSMVEQDAIQSSVKGSPEINCFLLETQACGVLELFSATTPVISGSAGSLAQEQQMNVIDMEANFRLKSGTIGIKYKSNITNHQELYQNIDVETIAKQFFGNALFDPSVWSKEDENDPIVKHLKEWAENGSTFEMLQETSGLDKEALINKLSDLKKKQIVRDVGYYERLLVLTEYIKPWAIKVDKNTSLIPMPWLDLEGNVNYKVFLDWTGVILDKVTDFPNCSLTFLAESCEFLTARSCQFIGEFLEKLGIITLSVLKTAKCDLFSDDFNDIEFIAYNTYESFDNICLFPTKDAFTKFSYVKKCMTKLFLQK